MNEENKPPFLAAMLLDWLIPDTEFHTPLGDYEEYFHEIRRERGLRYARWWYRGQVLQMMPERLYARCYWGIIMLRNYLTTAVRNLRKHTGFAFINIVGLSTGIACFLLISFFVAHEWSFDRFWPNSENIYRMSITETTPTSESTYTVTPAPLAGALTSEFPEVIASTRLSMGRTYSISYENRAFPDNRLFRADSNFFDVLSVPFLEGDPATALQAPSSVVITDEVAERMFGAANPIGKVVEVEVDSETSVPYTVTGVARQLPENSHFQFDLIATWWREGQEQRERTSWLGYSLYTYFVLDENADPRSFEQKLPAMLARHAGPEIEQAIGITWAEQLEAGNLYDYFILPLRSIHLRSTTPFEIQPPGSARTVAIFAGIALFILLMACVNYMNLSTARAFGRAREIGMRKAMGSRRGQIASQMLAESSLMSLLAVVAAIGLLIAAEPAVSGMADTSAHLEFLRKPIVWAALIGLALVIGLLAGSYPAFFLSRFAPAVIVKGGSAGPSGGIALRNGLVVFQFVVSICLIVGTIVVEKQLGYILERDPGFDAESTLVIENAAVLGTSQKTFKEKLLERPDITTASLASSLPSTVFSELFLAPVGAPPGEQYNVYVTIADHDYGDALGLRLVAGRAFDPERSTDSLSVIVNEALVRTMGLGEDPIGKEIHFGGGDQHFPILGVVQDFNFQSLHTEVHPLAYFIDDGPMSRILVRTRMDHPAETIAALEEEWNRFVSAQPFTFSFLTDRMADLYQSEIQMRKLFSAFSILALLIACLGLFGLTAFAVERKTKEIGIRKALGATTTGIVATLSKETLRLAIVAVLIATPMAWFGVHRWLEAYAYRIEPGPFVFLSAGAITVLIAVATVGIQVARAARRDPVDALRYE